MAFLYICEYERPQDGNAFPMQVADETNVGLDQTRIANDGASTPSAAFAATTRFVRIHSDSVCSIKFGPNPTATTSSKRMAAGQTEYYYVKPGDKVAAILNT